MGHVIRSSWPLATEESEAEGAPARSRLPGGGAKRGARNRWQTADRPADRLGDWLTGRPTGRLADRLTDWATG
eukprot:198878-Prorocentrum_minimum.AAC.1